MITPNVSIWSKHLFTRRELNRPPSLQLLKPETLPPHLGLCYYHLCPELTPEPPILTPCFHLISLIHPPSNNQLMPPEIAIRSCYTPYWKTFLLSLEWNPSSSTGLCIPLPPFWTTSPNLECSIHIGLLSAPLMNRVLSHPGPYTYCFSNWVVFHLPFPFLAPSPFSSLSFMSPHDHDFLWPSSQPLIFYYSLL